MYYLDNAATTPLTDAVKNRIIDLLDEFGNPSSTYELGLTTKRIINETRELTKKFVNCPANGEIIFTSSGSAANCLAIKGLANFTDDYVVLYSPTAHKSMVKCCKSLPYHHAIEVDDQGFIMLDALERQLDKYYPEQTLVCFEAASSELGTIQKIREITKLVHKYHGIVVVDFTGYIPYFKVNVIDLDVDVATFSGHKLHALKGVGVMYKIDDVGMEPLVYGSQEFGYFAGTENVIGIASLGEAMRNYKYDFVMRYQRDKFWEMIKNQIPDCYLIGANSEYNRLPFNLFVCFKGIKGSDVAALLEIKGVCVSTGSACNNGSEEPSSALVAIGMNEDDYNSCIRFTFSGEESYLDLEEICSAVKESVEFFRG